MKCILYKYLILRSSQYYCVPFICTPASRYYPKVCFHEIPPDSEDNQTGLGPHWQALAIEITYSHMCKYYMSQCMRFPTIWHFYMRRLERAGAASF